MAYNDREVYYDREQDTGNVWQAVKGLFSKRYTSPFERFFEKEPKKMVEEYGGEQETHNIPKAIWGLLSEDYTSPFERYFEKQGISRHGEPFGMASQGLKGIGNIGSTIWDKLKGKPSTTTPPMMGGEEYTTNLLKRAIAPFTEKYTSPEELWAEKQGITRQGTLTGGLSQAGLGLGNLLSTKAPANAPNRIGNEEYTKNLLKRIAAPFTEKYTSPEELWAEKQGISRTGEPYGMGMQLLKLLEGKGKAPEKGEEKTAEGLWQTLKSPFSSRYSTGVERWAEKQGISEQGKLLGIPAKGLAAIASIFKGKDEVDKEIEAEDKKAKKEDKELEEDDLEKELNAPDWKKNEKEKGEFEDDELTPEQKQDLEDIDETVNEQEELEQGADNASAVEQMKKAAGMTVAGLRPALRTAPLASAEGLPGVPSRQPSRIGLQSLMQGVSRPTEPNPTLAESVSGTAKPSLLKRGLGTLFDVAQLYAGALPQRVPTATTMPAPIETRKMRARAEQEMKNAEQGRAGVILDTLYSKLGLTDEQINANPNLRAIKEKALGATNVPSGALGQIMNKEDFAKLPEALQAFGGYAPGQAGGEKKIAADIWRSSLNATQRAEAKKQDIAIKLKGIEIQKDNVDWGYVGSLIKAQNNEIFGTEKYMAYGEAIMKTLGVQIPPEIPQEEKASWLSEFLNGISNIIPPREGKQVTKTDMSKKDKFGYVIGQTAVKNGITYEYKGNNKWEPKS